MDQPGPRRLRSILQPHAGALGGFVALTMAVYWPVVADFRTRLLADGADGSFFVWNTWWFPRSVAGGRNPFNTTDLFHPLGASLGFDTVLAPVSLASWPLQRLFGLPVAVNAAQLGAVVLSALGVYLLALHVGATRFPAFVAGAAFAFTPYRIGHVASHFNLNHTEVLPFGLLALLRLYDRPTRGRAAALGAAAAYAWWSDSYYSVFLGLAGGLVLVWRWRQTVRRPFLVRLGQAALVAALLAVPLFAAQARDLRRHELDAVPGWGGADVYSADVVSWITPPKDRRFLPDMATGFDPTVNQGERLVFPTWTLLALGAAGAIWGGRRRRGVWVVVFGVFFVLSLGPFLQVDGWTGDRYHRFLRSFSVPLPYLLLRALPVVNGVRAPGRFAVVAVLALAVLAALALTRLARVDRRVGVGAAVAALALVLA